MVEIIEHVEYDKLPTPERCFVMGAGASYDSGVPVEQYILDAAKWCAGHLRKQPHIGDYETKAVASIEEIVEAAEKVLGTNLIGPLDPVYQKLDAAGQVTLSRIAVFVLSRVGWHDDHSKYFYRYGLYDPDETFSYQRFCRELKPTDVVITFNYDTFLEKGISPPWKIHYGAPISPWPTEDRYPVHGKDEAGTVRLLRLHGSASWLTCPRCGCTEDFGYMNINELGISDVTERQKDTDAYCPKCMREMGMSAMGLESVSMHVSESVYRMFEREHCMILPAARRSYDREPLQTIWSLCESALSVCEEIISVGYSIPPVDTAFRDCVKRATTGLASKPRVTVVDPSDATQTTWRDFAVSIGLSPPLEKKCTFSVWLDERGAPAVGKGTTK